MTLQNFLKMHQNGMAQACISIHRLPYSYDKRRYENTYFEEGSQEEILESKTFKEIRNSKVNHFNIIGGGIYKVELCIYLVEK